MAFNYVKPKFHMGSKLKNDDMIKFVHSVPGPGSHSPSMEPSRQKSPVYSMGARLASPMANKTIYVPGPGSYANDSEKLKAAKAPSFGFGTSKRPDMASNGKNPGPGPGTYKLPTRVANVANFAMPN